MGFSGLVERLRCALPAAGARPPDTWSGAVGPETPVERLRFTVFDTELTGLHPRTDHIVSIGAVRMTGSTIRAGETFARLVRPPGPVRSESVIVHGITPDDLADQPGLEEVMPQFLDFIRETVLVGHFIGIDLGFVNRFLRLRRRGCLRNPALDTRRLHDWLYENSPRFRRHFGGGTPKSDLFTVAERYGVEVGGGHDAALDAWITAQLFQRLLHFSRETGIGTLGELRDVGGV